MGLIAFIRKIFNKKPEKKKLALALGSGGAKGFAHLGALKAFEEEGISFDIVTGTSIGSIVGAFYARGFSSENILHIFLSTDFTELIRHVRPKMNMKPIEDVIDKDLGGLDFSELKVPFACWATDEAENTGVLLNSGNVARACCASSAMPPFFSGVSISGHILADGAYTNSIPADVARNMGADFVIGIDLSAYKPVAEKKQNPVISAVFNKFNGQIKLVKLPDAKKRGYDNSDVMLEPNLREWRATEFSQKNWKKIYDEGYTEAKNRMPEIKFMLKKAGFLFGGVKK